MHNVITTYGGGEVFSLVFNGIAALFKADQTGLVMPLMRVGLMAGLVYVVVLMLFRSSLIEGMRWFLWVIIATNLIFLPKTTIFIDDPLHNKKYKIDHVPFALGTFASFVSHVGKTITEKMEAVFTLPDYMPYHKTGTVFASSLMSQVGQFRIVDPIFKGNMERFVNQCIVYDVMIGHKYTLTDLQNAPNIWTLVKSQASPVLGFLYKVGTSPGSVVSCKVGAEHLEKLWNSEIKKAIALYGSRVQDRILTESAFTSNLMGSARLLSSAAHLATSASDILRQEMMINAIEEGANNKLSELGSASNYAATKALLQQRSAYAAAGETAARTLFLLKNVIEALSYALFIFIVVLALLPSGYKILLRYCEILAWTQLWAPLYAVLNLIMTLYGKSESVAHGFKDGLTLLNSSAIINANADMVALAAWLSVSIPFISYGILKQGAGAFVGLAQHLGSAMQSAASSAAAEAVSGNINMSNVTMGTQAYQNKTAFQENTSPVHSASHFKAMNTSGMEQTTFADGGQSFNDQGILNLPVKLMATVNSSFEHQQRLHEAESMAHSKSVAAGKSIESAAQQFSNVLERIGTESSAGTQAHKNLTSNESKAFQDHQNLVKDLTESGHLTESQAHEAAFMAKVGTPEIFSVGLGASTNFSSSATQQKAIGEARSLANQKGYSYSLDSVLSASKSIMEEKSDSKGAELAQGASASLNQAQHLRDEASVAHTHVKEVSDSFASSQRNDIQESRDFTRNFLEYVANQPVNRGPEPTRGEASSQEKIGMNRAVAIMRQGGAEYQAYRQRFQEENPQYSIQEINVSQQQQTLQGQYEGASAQLKEENPTASYNAQNKQQILSRGKDLNLNPDSSPSQGLSKEVESIQKDHNKRIEGRKIDIGNDKQQFEEKVSDSQAKSLPGTNFKNIGQSLTGGSPLSLSLDKSPPKKETSSSQTNAQRFSPVNDTQSQAKSLTDQKSGNSKKQFASFKTQQTLKEK